AALARIRGWSLLAPARGLVLKPPDEHTPSGLADLAVQPGLGRDVPPRRFGGALGGAGHAPDIEVFDADHVEAPRDVRGGLLRPVLAPVGLAGLHPRNLVLGVAAPGRPTLGAREFAFQPQYPRSLAGGQAGHRQHLPGGQGSADLDAPVDAHDIPVARGRNRTGDYRERDVPAAGAVTGHPERLHVTGQRAGEPKPDPADFRDLDLRPLAVEPAEVPAASARAGHPEPFVPPGFPPRMAWSKSRSACCCTVWLPSRSHWLP